MTSPADSLPPEIINCILLLLDVEDIISLGKCMPLPITKEVYDNAFPDGTRFSHYDIKMFEERARAKLYVIGDVGDEYKYSKDVPDNYEFVGAKQYRRMHTLLKVETIGPIMDVNIDTDTVHVLNTRGEVFDYPMLPEDYSAIHGNAYVPYRVDPRTDYKDDYALGRGLEYDDVPYVHMDNLSAVSEELFSRPVVPTNFLSIDSSAFESEVFAGDDKGLVWRWMDDWTDIGHETADGNPSCLVEEGTGKVLRGRVLKVTACEHDYSTCLVEGEGVFKWDGIQYCSVLPNGWRGGYRCFDDRMCHLNVKKVSLPGAHVKDYAVFGRALAYLNFDGTFAIVPLCGECPGLSKAIKQINDDLAPFVHLSAFRTMLTVTNSKGCVFRMFSSDVHSVDGQCHLRMQTRARLGSLNVASVVMGMWHGLTLTAEGDIYSWGSERNYSGCLGLGKYQDVIKSYNTRLETFRGDVMFSVNEPSKMRLPGKAFAVWAGQDFSAMLIYDE